MMGSSQKTWVEVSGSTIRDNIQAIKKCLGNGPSVMAVVKSNAYGHGLEGVARIAARGGAKWLGVDSIDEARRTIAAAPKNPALILGYTPLARVAEAVRLGARLTVYNPETVKIAARAGRTARLHLKLETGTTRQGVGERELLNIVRLARKTRRVVLEGLSTHYANIEDTTDHRYAARQLREYVRLAAIAERAYGRPIPVKHTACSAAAILFPETYFALARIGLALYGLWPSRETQVSAAERGVRLNIAPALAWKTIVAQVKEAAKGTPISYGLTATLRRRSKIAVIPVGYWDGFDRKLSNSGAILVRGQRAPVLGRVCMNMFMADVTDIPGVQAEDEVVLLGGQKNERISAEEIASKTGTINYEVVTRINPFICRRYV
ncbi:alanine racemase [Patescibacteria group bacterium]|nr:MAG: alanine racemase [Patescibacteria group bacterium]